jgi:hypothetical protein
LGLCCCFSGVVCFLIQVLILVTLLFSSQGRQREFAALSVQFELLFCTSVRRVCSKPSSIPGRPSRVTSDRLDSLSLLHLAVCDNKSTTLQQLLIDYFCPEDKGDSGLLVSRLADVPTNLSILLKRVQQMGSSRSSKRMAQVTLPSCLALDCFAQHDVAEGKVHASVEMLRVHADSRRVYDLVSVVLHSGTVSRGHYTCATLGPDSVWSVYHMCLLSLMLLPQLRLLLWLWFVGYEAPWLENCMRMDCCSDMASETMNSVYMYCSCSVLVCVLNGRRLFDDSTVRIVSIEQVHALCNGKSSTDNCACMKECELPCLSRP